MRSAFMLILLAALAACGRPEPGTEPATTDASAGGYQFPEVNTEPSESWEEAFAAATAAIERSAEKGHAWLSADQLLEQAQAAYDAGDEALAIALADEARIHGDLASIQADYEKTVWQDIVVTE